MLHNLGRRRLAGELGFEPRLTESESAVLPLNYSPIPSRDQHISRDRETCLAAPEQPFKLLPGEGTIRPLRPVFQVALLAPRLGFAAALFL